MPNFGDRVWLAYLSTAFQTGFWRKDIDPDLEKERDPTMDKLTGINLGITLTPRDVTSLTDDENLPDRQYSMIPFETFREEGANNLRARSIAHELGHQFGIPHYKGKSNLMNESLDQGNNGTFLPFQLNLIRSRKLSSGAGVE